GGRALLYRRQSPSARARLITSGLRSIGTNGPEMSAPDRAALNSSIAFFCASVNLSAGIGGMRSCAPAETAIPITATANRNISLGIGPPRCALYTEPTLPPVRLGLIGFGYWG